MSRKARIVAAGYPHHIIHRGNNRQNIFFVDDDRRKYLQILKEECNKYELSIIGYCLMTNHIHLIATPTAQESLAKAVGRTHLRYTQFINKYHNRCGHLWQNRFRSCVLDKDYYWNALKYVERNPVRAKIVSEAWEYEWSSAGAHSGFNDETGLLELKEWHKEMKPENWKSKLVEMDDDEAVELLKVRTGTGMPLGNDSFISKLETQVGRRLRPLPVGRPENENK